MKLFCFQSLRFENLQCVVSTGKLEPNDFVSVEPVLSQCNDLLLVIVKAERKIAPGKVIIDDGTEVNDISFVRAVNDYNGHLDYYWVLCLLKGIGITVRILRADITTKS